jgi:hypothetical protein
LARRCLANSWNPLSIDRVELSHVLEIADGEAASEFAGQPAVPADVSEFPFQQIAVTCPRWGEQRRYMPSEVVFGLPHHPATKGARKGKAIPG